MIVITRLRHIQHKSFLKNPLTGHISRDIPPTRNKSFTTNIKGDAESDECSKR